MKTMDRAPVFQLGRIAITPGAEAELGPDDILVALIRHIQGDWGELCAEDCRTNEHALQYGYRLMSQYTSGSGKTFWIITEHDRSATTILMPNEY